MNIDDFKIEIKKYDEEKHFVVINLNVLNTIWGVPRIIRPESMIK